MSKRLAILAFMFVSCLLGGQHVWAQDTFNSTDGKFTFTILDYDSHLVSVRAAGTLSGDIVIPGSVTNDEEEYTVTEIAQEGFQNQDGITGVVIQPGIQVIRQEAFEDCNNIVSITLPNTLRTICNGAMYDCTSLQSITIPSSVTRIERAPFHRDDALKTVVFEDGEEELIIDNYDWGYYSWGSANMFESELSRIYIGRKINMFDDEGRLATKPQVVETGGAFDEVTNKFCKENSRLTTVVIGGDVKYIGEEAFYHCANLTSVTINAPVESIGTDAFCGTSITEITLPQTLTLIGYGAFYNANKLQSLAIPSSVTWIGRAAFHGTDALRNVVIEDGSESLLFENFEYYYGWGSTNMFESALDKIYIGRSISPFEEYKITTSAAEIETGGGFDNIFDEFTSSNNNLTKLTIGGAVKSVGSKAFYHCGNLTDVTITAPLESMGVEAFCGTPISKIELPQTLTNMGHGLFWNCSNLESITIPSSVTWIGRSAFYGTRGLRNVTFEDGPESVTFENDSYYYGDGNSNIFENNLDSLYIGRNFSFFDEGIFASSASVVKLGQYVTDVKPLRDTRSIASVIAPYTEPFTLEGDNDFSSTTKSSANLFIPWGTKQAYTEAGWNFTDANIQYNEYQLTLTTTQGGTLKADELVATMEDNDKQTFIPRETDVLLSIDKDEDYDLTSLTVNGASVAVTDGQYTIERITDDMAVVATFTEKPKFTITASAGTGGAVSVQGGEYAASGSAQVYRDRDAVISVQPSEDYALLSVLLNGENVTGQMSGNELTIENVQADATVEVNFMKMNLNVNLVSTVGGSITLGETTATADNPQSVLIERAGNVEITVTPDADYDFASLKCGDVVVYSPEVGDAPRTGGTYVVTNLQDEPTFTATFTEKPFVTISATATKGTVDINGAGSDAQQVRRDADVTLTFAPIPNHYLSAVLVNGEDVTSQLVDGQLTLSNVQGDQNVVAKFRVDTSRYHFDVNGDGKVTPADITAIVNYLLELEEEEPEAE